MTGNLSCKACNMMGCSTNNTILVVSDLDGEGVRSSLQNVYEEDSFEIYCYVPKYPCKRVWEWTCQKNASMTASILTTGPSNSHKQFVSFFNIYFCVTDLMIEHTTTNYSTLSKVRFKRVGLNQSGIYNCKAICENEKHLHITMKYVLHVKSELIPIRELKIFLKPTFCSCCATYVQKPPS
jgi:hypothetical protein